MKSMLGWRIARLSMMTVSPMALAALATPAAAQAQIKKFDIPAQSLSSAILEFSRQSDVMIVVSPELTKGKQSQAVKGTMPVNEAIEELLKATPLRAVPNPAGGYRIAMAGNAARAGDDSVASALDGAEGNSPAPGDQGADIVVTAQKFSQRVQDVPMAVSVISGSALTASHADTLQDVVNKVPGLQLISSGPATNLLVIRGISTGGGINSSVATYVNEVPYTSVGPFANSNNLAPNFDTYDLSRIEVLRGPQGTLYGANALGGLLKYVTNAPDPSRFSASGLVGLSSVDHSGQTGWEAHGMVNVPLGSTAALRVVAHENYFPGVIDDPSRGIRDIDHVRRYGIRAALLWQVTPELSINLSANYQHLVSGDTNTVDLVGTTLQPLYGTFIHQRALAQTQRVNNQIYNAVVTWDLGFASLLSSSSYTKADPLTISDVTASYGPVLKNAFGGNLGAAITTSLPVHSWIQELRLSSPKGQSLEWMAGFYFVDQSAVELQRIRAVNLSTHQIDDSLTPKISDYHITPTYREYAGFGNLTYHVTPAFEVSAGGRYSTNKQTYRQVTSGALAGTSAFTTKSNQNVSTYSANAKYRLNPGLMIYGRIATGFVPGGPNDILPGSTVPDTFRSSSTTNYELGIKGSALDGRLNYDLDVFQVKWKDIQLFAVVNGLFAITNGGRASSRGIEGGLSLVPVKGLTLSLNGAYTDAHLTEDTPASSGGHDGDRLPLSPHIAGTIGADYEQPLAAGVTGFGGVEWHYTGNRLSVFSASVPRATLPSYSLVDLRAGLRFKDYTFNFYIKNIGDVRAISQAVPQRRDGITGLQASILTPRTIGVTLGAKF